MKQNAPANGKKFTEYEESHQRLQKCQWNCQPNQKLELQLQYPKHVNRPNIMIYHIYYSIWT